MARTPPTHHEFKGLSDWVEIFRAGKHKDSKGRECEFTTGDLDQIIANAAAEPAPAVLGHPKHNAPAYAWTSGLKRDGDMLFAKFSDINTDFEAGVKSGAYRNRSVSIYKDGDAGWKLRHVGWLGAEPPAIAGLKPVEFSASVDAHEFSSGDDMQVAWALTDISGAFRRLRDWLIEDKGLDVADQVLPDYHVTSIADSAQRVRQSAIDELNAEVPPAPTLFTAPTPASTKDIPMSFTQADLDRVAAETAARVQAETAAQFSAAQAELTRLQSEQQRTRIEHQVDGWKAKGLVTPAESTGLVEFMASIETANAAQFEFSAAGGAAAKKTPAEWFAEFMASRQPVVTLGKRQGDDPAPVLDKANPRAIADAAVEFQAAEAKSGRTVSVEAAVAHVMTRSAG